MEHGTDTNAAIWKSTSLVERREADGQERVQKNAAQWRLMGELLPYQEQDAFTFLDLGAGTGPAARAILRMYPQSSAILTDFSVPMMSAGAAEMQEFDGRFRFVEFDMSTNRWPSAVPTTVDAVVTSMCIHHLPDHRKAGMFAEIFARLVPGSWYINYDSVSTADRLVEAAWARVADRDPAALRKRLDRTAEEQARHDNHVRYLRPLDEQLGYLESAGFEAIDVYWKHLDDVIYAGRKPR